MERFVESNLTLRSIVMFKWKKIKATYLRRHKRCFMVVYWKICEGKVKKRVGDEKWEVIERVITRRVSKYIRDGECDEVQSMNQEWAKWRYEFAKWFVFYQIKSRCYTLTILVVESLNQGWTNIHIVNPIIKVTF